MTLNSDYQNFFSGKGPGYTRDWAQGSLSYGNDGNATYTGPLGNTSMFNKSTPLSTVYNSNPFIAQAWDDAYGTDVTGYLKPQSNFTIPNNIFPTSVSSGTTGSTGKSNSASRSGINWGSDLASGLLPNLIASGQNAQSVADNMGATLQDQYANTMRQAMNPQNFQGTLNHLANTGMINSSTGENALANAGRGIAGDIAGQQFKSKTAQQQAQMQVPSILANLAALANETSSSSSATNKSSGTNRSYQADPLAPYRLNANIMLNQPTV